MHGSENDGEVHVEKSPGHRSTHEDGHAKDAISGDDLEKLHKALKHIEDRFESQTRLQEQKDISQDEMLEMQFDSVRRDLSICIKNSDLEDQKSVLLAKIQTIEIELKDSMRSMGNSLREEISRDARKLQDQLEKVSKAVLEQVKMVDERLKENAEADGLFEDLVRERLARVEAELGLNDEGGTGESSPDSASAGGTGGGGGGGPGNRRAGSAPQQAIQNLEGRIDNLVARLDLVQRELDEQKRQSAQELAEDAEAGIPSGREAKKKLEHRVATLEDKVEEVVVKEAVATKEIQELKEKVSLDNPLDWLEERVGELARKRGGDRVDVIARLAEVTSQMEALEKWREEFLAEQEQYRGQQQQAVAEAAAAVAAHSPEAATACEDEAKSVSSSKGGRSSTRGASRKGQNAVDGSQPSFVNLFEDMERLRCIIECMEETMPLEVRRSIQFFKGARKGGDASSRGGPSVGSNSGGIKQRDNIGDGKVKEPAGLELEAEVLGLRSEADEQAQRVQRCEEILAREHSNLLKALRGVEREQDQMKLKVDDLWHKLPQLATILAPLQVHVASSAGGTDTRVESTIEALKPLSGLMEAALQKSIDKLRQDLLLNLTEVSGRVDLKASADEFSTLRDRVERWARSPTPSPSRASLSAYKNRALDSMESTRDTAHWPQRSLERSKTSGGTCHEKCKATTCPSSASTGRLPALSKTR